MTMDFTWLPDAAWRGALLLAIASAVARALRSKPAAVRHALWAGALAGAMAMPLLAVVAPMRLPVTIPSPLRILTPASGGDRVAGTESGDPASSLSPSPAFRANAATNDGGQRDVVAAAPPDEEGVAIGGTPTGRGPQLTPARVAIAVWLLGAVVLGLRLLIGFMGLRRLRHRAEEIEEPDVLDLAVACAERMGTHVTPRLLVSPALSMPCTAGSLRPVVLLPSEYAAWTRERLEVVLLHELGHIRRADIVPHLLAELARVVYWFNPLVWLAAARLRVEAETATDELVVRAGAQPSDYAAHLLDIVRQARAVWHPAPVIPLARRSEFEGRILTILESGGRALPSPRAAVAAVVLVAALSLGVASVGAETAVAASESGAIGDDDAPSLVVPDEQRDEQRDAGSGDLVPAAQALAQSTDRAAMIGALAEALRDPVASVRQAAAEALGNTKDSAAVRALIEVLRTDENAAVRRSAAWALGEMEDAAAVSALSDALLRDRDPQVRRNAASALGSIDHPRATPALTQALERDAEVTVRVEAAEALAQLEDEASVDALIRSLERDDDPEVRRAVIEALDNLESTRAAPAVARALRDANVVVRRAAADALGSMDDREVVPALVAAARDADLEVRRAVVEALASLQDRRAMPVFVAALAEADVEVRRGAAQGFSQLENVRTAPPELIRAMDDRDAEVRHSVAHALGQIQDPGSLRALLGHVADPSVDVRRAVVEALDEFDDPSVVGALRTALRDADSEVRETAARALGKRSRK